jgi:hypothetical protein
MAKIREKGEGKRATALGNEGSQIESASQIPCLSSNFSSGLLPGRQLIRSEN